VTLVGFSGAALAGALALGVVVAPEVPASRPRVLLLDAARLAAAKEAIARHEPAVAAAWQALAADADKALRASRFSVVDKGVTPPSGDKHDYTSQAPYFWPDPSKPGGLPYIRRDGERNPEINRITDHRALDGFAGSVETLALASYLSGDQRYARKAGALLRAWFLDDATRMNPNLEYAQFVPGVNTGRGIGLIETRGLTRVVDAIGLLETSPAWRAEDSVSIRRWFERFVAWMQESRNGRDEAAARNNHGTYYDLQLASYALFLGRDALARDVLENAREKRIRVQIEPDGRQPLELARTNAWSYSVGNLDGLTLLATLGDRVGVDLWHYTTGDGRSIRAALLNLAPYAFGERAAWPHAQIVAWSPQSLFPVLRRAAPHFPDDAELRRVLVRVPPRSDTDRRTLTGGQENW